MGRRIAHILGWWTYAIHQLARTGKTPRRRKQDKRSSIISQTKRSTSIPERANGAVERLLRLFGMKLNLRARPGFMVLKTILKLMPRMELSVAPR